jgi:hypothetical protein
MLQALLGAGPAGVALHSNRKDLALVAFHNADKHASCGTPVTLEAAASVMSPAFHLPMRGTGVMIVGFCEAQSADFELVCTLHKDNVIEYASQHGYGFDLFHRPNSTLVNDTRRATWLKIPALYRTIVTPGVLHAFWMDSDSLFMNMRTTLPLPSTGRFLAISTHNNPGSHYTDAGQPSHNADFPNAGHFALTSGTAAETFLQRVWATCPSPWSVGVSCANETFNATSHHLNGRAEGDEQAAIIFVLGGERSECADHLDCRNGCLHLTSTSDYDILPAAAMNQNLEDFTRGDFLVHFWEYQCARLLGRGASSRMCFSQRQHGHTTSAQPHVVSTTTPRQHNHTTSAQPHHVSTATPRQHSHTASAQPHHVSTATPRQHNHTTSVRSHRVSTTTRRQHNHAASA